MNNEKSISKPYFISVSILTFILPIICLIVDIKTGNGKVFSFGLFGKWFIFSAAGLRLLVAGIKQTVDPAFTAKEIFHIEHMEVLPIVRELGFANICFGLIGIVSLLLPGWRIVSAFGSGLYYGIAGLQHIIKKPVGANEKFALVTDILIFIVLVVYFIKTI